MTIYSKAAGGRLAYSVKWPGTADIVRSDWAVIPDEPGGLRIVERREQDGWTGATFGGGVPGRLYRIANDVSRSDGRAERRTLTIQLEAR
jgi:hypothetical protein